MPTSKQLRRQIQKLEKQIRKPSVSVRRFAEIDSKLRGLKAQLASQEKFEKDPASFMRRFLQ